MFNDNQRETIEKRKNLCHAVVEGGFDALQEEWIDEGLGVLKTPINCPGFDGDWAITKAGVILMAVTKAGLVYFDTQGDMRHDLQPVIDAAMPHGWTLDEKWLIHVGRKTVPWIDGLLIDADGTVKKQSRAAITARKKYLAEWPGRVRYYVGFCAEHLKEWGDHERMPIQGGTSVPGDGEGIEDMIMRAWVPKNIFVDALISCDMASNERSPLKIKQALTKYLSKKLNLPYRV